MSYFSARNLALLFIALFITASTVIAVTAYSSATVTSPAVLKIVSTDQALLALSPENDPCDMVKLTGDGVLKFEFFFDTKIEQYYKFDSLFRITNNSADNVKVTVESEGISYISIKSSSEDEDIFFVENGANTGDYHSLSSGGVMTVEVSFNIPVGTSPMDGIIRVKAQAE